MIRIFLHQQPRRDYAGFVWKAIHEVKIILGTILEPQTSNGLWWYIWPQLTKPRSLLAPAGSERPDARPDMILEPREREETLLLTALCCVTSKHPKQNQELEVFSVSLGITTWIEYHMEWRGLIAVAILPKWCFPEGVSHRLETVAKAP